MYYIVTDSLEIMDSLSHCESSQCVSTLMLVKKHCLGFAINTKIEYM